MDKLIHEKEITKAQETPTVIPMVTTAMPSTLVKIWHPKYHWLLQC